MEMQTQAERILGQLPGLNCGLCGFRSCAELANFVVDHPDEIKRCANLGSIKVTVPPPMKQQAAPASMAACNTCALADAVSEKRSWKDSLGREFDFVLQTFQNEPGPRETMKLHNPALTEKMGIKKGDIIIGRPLGMSCGCPITHCGVVMDADYKTGVIVWCVTGPLQPRASGFKDVGYYSAEAYEGIIKETQKDIKVGMRYWFLPRRCMLQWRHSGLINFVSKTKDGYQVRIEGLMIG
jgi:uncharacterized Fe-S cluster-containing protein